MHDNELWQKYEQNGTPTQGIGYSPAEFKSHPDEVMGNSHIWFWKKDATDSPEILLQKRSMTKVSKPGMFHISAGGHINIGESPVVAAVRETVEEMGININPSKLYYVGSMRIVRINPNSIVNVYLYELKGDEKFEYLDGEVDSVEWRSLENFKMITQSPNEYNLVDQGSPYFSYVIDALEHISKD
ncbi:NUDIX domain-containing protein [Candidatus Saccharibacteria bacterium]|nr:NUDIX domain-containing protein [Candidatus Saccharibacteria bacterium]